jgi:ABC-type sugar transport system permease subunit
VALLRGEGDIASARGTRLRPSAILALLWVAAPYLYLAPMLLLLGLFVYWPLIAVLGLSGVKWNLNPDMAMAFIGTANYERLIASSLFHDAMVNTVFYLVASIPLKILLPIPVVVAIWSLGRHGVIYRLILFLPTLISFVVVSIIFLWLFNPLGGMVPAFFQGIGVSIGNPLADHAAALWSVLLISTWKVLGFNVLFYLAGLSSIRGDLIEAMRIDGAGTLRIFTDLVWPLLTPTTFFVLVSTIIFTMQQVFTPIDILTGGGPQNGTTNLFYMVYQLTFHSFDVGLGAAGTVILFGMLFIATALKLRFLDRRVHYEQ